MSAPRSAPGSRGSSAEDELRLPRAPGVFRRFWARYPVFADAIVTAVALLFTIGPFSAIGVSTAPRVGLSSWWDVIAPFAFPVVIAGALTLMLRRRFPLIVFAASCVVAAILLLSPAGGGAVVIGFAAYAIAVYRGTRLCLIALAVGIGILTVLAVALTASGLITTQTMWNTILGNAVIAVIGALIGINVGGRKRYVEAIIDRSRQLLVERDQQALLSTAAERARIAREMHDIVSHSLTVIVALSDGAAATGDAARARAASAQAALTAREALTEMRAMLGVLRQPGAEAPLEPVASDEAGRLIDTVVERARHAGFPVTLVSTGELRMPPSAALALSRVVQEGVTNAMRHAPAARRIEIEVCAEAEAVTVLVRNDGVPASERERALAGGFGIRGLTERIDHVGGTLVCGPEVDDPGCWRLRARIPIVRAERAG